MMNPTDPRPLPDDAHGSGGLLDTLVDLVSIGGPVVWILLAMSVLALAIIVVKLWQFRGLGGTGASLHVREAVWLGRAGRPEEALTLLGRGHGAIEHVLSLALRGRWQGLPDAMIREETLRAASEMLEDLRAYFRPLEIIAALAPLLGLFGTVLGMIEAFSQLEAAGNQVNPSVLSGGIWEALLTTAVGLAVAIPVTAILAWLERRVDRLAATLESVITQVFTLDLSDASETGRREPQNGPRHDTRHFAVDPARSRA